MAIWGDNTSSDLEDFSPSSTIVPFDPPIPLLRGPIPAAPSDNPDAGPFVLAFNSAFSWRSAFESTQSKLIDQCLLAELTGWNVARHDGVSMWKAGARVGCSINASNKCKPPWWKSLFGTSPVDYAERERCEEREIASCLAASKEPCIRFAKDKCFPAFRDARIASTEWKGASHLVFLASRDVADGSDNAAADVFELKFADLELDCSPEVTTYRGSALLDNSSSNTTCNV